MPISYTGLTKLCNELDSELEEVCAENEMYRDTIEMQREQLLKSAQLLSLSKMDQLDGDTEASHQQPHRKN